MKIGWIGAFRNAYSLGVYSQLGLDASWPTLHASDEFKDIFYSLAGFNPVEFDAEEWAQLAEDAGMKYFVFTAKHAMDFRCLIQKQL